METKRLILSISIMMGLVMTWRLGVNYMYTQHPEWMAAEQTQTPTTAPSVVKNEPSAAVPTTGPTPVAIVSAAPVGFHTVGSGNAQPINLGSAEHGDPTYSMGLAINPTGASLSSVTLNEFYETAEQKSLYIFQTPVVGFEPNTATLASRSVTINGNDVDLLYLTWTQVSKNPTTAVYRAIINAGDKPELEIDKTFQVPPKNTPDGRGGYEILVNQGFKNLSGKPLNVKTIFNGPTPPARENDRSEDRQFIAGYDKGYQEVDVGHSFVGELTKDKPIKDIAALQKLPLLWVGAENSYFNAIIRPETPGGAVQLVTANARGLNPDAIADDRIAGMAIETNEFTIAPAATVSLNLRVFFGPKQRSLLGNSYYSAFPLLYNSTLIYASGFCSFITFAWLINALYGILWFFHLIFRDWGLAIIGLVCLVRVILHPITKKSQVNMMQMSKMGPELERIKKKYGDNKDELNKAMMGFYKTQGFTPILGCLPMLLQTPIWIALWSALQSTFDLRQAGFLRFGAIHLTWIKDLSHPDFLMHFDQPIALPFGWHLHGVNVLPILMAGVFFIQQKFQPVPATQTPEQAQQRKMMSWMSLLFPVMLYTGPSGLNLYILTSTTLGVIESKIIRDHIKQRDEAEKAGRIIIDAKPTRAKRKDKNEPPKQERKGIMGWIAEIQSKVEEARREAERRGKDRA
jgi:YidC/Oxa1 family membrane protein insertase